MSLESIRLLKIGGSLITDKARDCTFQHESAMRLANEVAALNEPIVLLHGTGSFGKPPARRFDYMDGFLSRERAAVVSEVEEMLDDLRRQFLQVFRSAGVAVYPLTAAALFRTSRAAISHCTVEPLRQLLERGMCPVISGAIVTDDKRDFAVLSSDLMAAALATALPARRLIFATDVPGLMRDSNASAMPVEVVSENDDLVQSSLDNDAEDVSAGMRGKLTAGFLAARAGAEVQLVDGRVPGRVLQALRGHPVLSTRLVARPLHGGMDLMPVSRAEFAATAHNGPTIACQ